MPHVLGGFPRRKRPTTRLHRDPLFQARKPSRGRNQIHLADQNERQRRPPATSKFKSSRSVSSARSLPASGLHQSRRRHVALAPHFAASNRFQPPHAFLNRVSWRIARRCARLLRQIHEAGLGSTSAETQRAPAAETLPLARPERAAQASSCQPPPARPAAPLRGDSRRHSAASAVPLRASPKKNRFIGARLKRIGRKLPVVDVHRWEEVRGRRSEKNTPSPFGRGGG